MRFRQYITERANVVGRMFIPDTVISKKDLRTLEIVLDRLFKTIGLEISFTKHFFDRVNDPRNKKQITIPELQQLYTKTYAKFGKQLSGMNSGVQGVIDDLQDDINIPFILKWDEQTKVIDLVAKTVMRKRNFKSFDRIFKV